MNTSVTIFKFMETKCAIPIQRHIKGTKPTTQDSISKVSITLAIVNEVPLAHWRIEAGLNLRDAMLINGTIFESEAWQ